MIVDVANFEQDVIEASHQEPVVVDFWAEWCGPCRMLGPILERLAEAGEGSWRLAKLNTDLNPDVSHRFNIQSIPAVKLFIDGAVTDEFIGALPEPAVRDWLARALPNEASRAIARARSAIDAGDNATAEVALRELLQDDPGNAAACVLLAGLIVFEDAEEAARLVDGAGMVGADLTEIREAVRTVTRLILLPETPEASAMAVETGGRAYLLAARELGIGDLDGGLGHLLQVVSANRRLDADGARRAAVAVFTLLGSKHPLTQKHRRALEMVLF
jgi:putative thioredoxin